MKRATAVSLVLTALFVAAPQAQAASNPIIDGAIAGLEFCPQSVCGAARFTGLFVGRAGARRLALGSFDVAINHDPLPEPGQSAAITGGAWSLSFIGIKISGVVTQGTLLNNGDNTFSVAANLQLLNGGTGNLSFAGLLNHNTLIPTVSGRLSQ